MKPKTKEIKQHENNYWHIPKFAILPLIGFMIFAYLSYANYFLINKEVVSYAFTCQENCNKLILNDIYPIIGEYILISLSLISLVAFFKKGYDNLKHYKDGGLIIGLITGLISGLILGLIIGLIIGLITGLIWGLIEEFN